MHYPFPPYVTLVQNCEWRISIYGRNVNEWDKLAKWVINNELFSHNVRWLVQIPRLYDMFKQSGAVQSFEDIIRSKCDSGATWSKV